MKYKNQVDYYMLFPAKLDKVKNVVVDVILYFNVDSDHRTIKCEILFKKMVS